MLIIASTGETCIRCELGTGASGGGTSGSIKKSVGVNGFNQRDDVLTIQKLLNSIDPTNGGANPLLGEDGWIGPKTNGAIKVFQQRWKLGSDNRVDPNGPMLAKMNELPKRPRFEDAAAARLVRAAKTMPTLIAMARGGELMLDQALIALRGGSTGSARSFRLASLYFKLGGLPQDIVAAKLQFIRTTFVRVRNVLTSPPSPVTGGNPFGVNVFANDPLGHGFKAYVPTEITIDPKKREHPEVHPGRVFLCVGIDTTADDLFSHILMHEMFHFVDEETKERKIGDHGYGPKAMQLPHEIRMHNSDNYALFSSHAHFGRARLLQSQPKLTQHIPTDLE